MKKMMTLATLLLIALFANAQMLNPVKFSTQLKTNGTAEAEIVFSGKIDAGWHVYSTNLGSDGPISATFNVTKLDGVELVGKLTPRGKEIAQYDKLFEMKLRYFEGSVQFVQKVKFTKPNYTIDAYLEYGACNDQNCMPPTSVSIKQSGKSPAVATDNIKKNEPQGTDEQIDPSTSAAVKADSAVSMTENAAGARVDSAANVQLSAGEEQALWNPVVQQLQAFGGTNDIANHSLLYIFLMGLVGGLLALVMPCIWPIIPMTVSFFLKRSKDDKRKGIRDAVTYGISIIVIYLGLGLVITALFGPSKLNELSTNAVFNIFLFALLVAFAFSFFGWFEIKLPDSWANSVDSKSHFDILNGVYAGAGIIFLYRTYHRIAACSDRNVGQLGRTCGRNVRFCSGIGTSFHPVCIVPVALETSAEVRFVDEHGESRARFYRTCIRFEVPFSSRSRLWMAHSRP